ncbi:hypothetical protein, partial [Membranihabitans maritimus]|uniref:hypothetical protein n=1 Tax=Membranihabitans maritimus TaxID=2904244 RepID=UPI001F3E7E21
TSSVFTFLTSKTFKVFCFELHIPVLSWFLQNAKTHARTSKSFLTYPGFNTRGYLPLKQIM